MDNIIPDAATAHSFFANDFHKNCPFNWKNVRMWATKNINIPMTKGATFILFKIFSHFFHDFIVTKFTTISVYNVI